MIDYCKLENSRRKGRQGESPFWLRSPCLTCSVREGECRQRLILVPSNRVPTQVLMRDEPCMIVCTTEAGIIRDATVTRAHALRR